MAVAKRCPYCLKKLRADGTCANQNCPRYVPETTETKETTETTDTAKDK